MTQEQAELIAEAIQADNGDASIRNDYSGRFMYGNTTHAVVTDMSAGNVLGCLINHLVQVAKNDIETEVDLNEVDFVNEIKQDQMGRGIVLY